MAVMSLLVFSVTACELFRAPGETKDVSVARIKSFRSAEDIVREAYARSQILALGHAEHGRNFSVHKLLVGLLANDDVRFDRDLRYIVLELSAHPVLAGALAKLAVPDGERSLTAQEQSVLQKNMLNSPEGFILYHELLPVLRGVNAERKARGIGPILPAPTDAIPLNGSDVSVPRSNAVLEPRVDFVNAPGIREETAAENFIRLLTQENGEAIPGLKVIVLWHIIHLVRGHESIMSPNKYEPTAWLQRSHNRLPQLAEQTKIVFFDQPSANPAHNPERGLNYQTLGVDPESILLKGFFIPDDVPSKETLRETSMFLKFRSQILPPRVPKRLQTLFDAVVVGK